VATVVEEAGCRAALPMGRLRDGYGQGMSGCGTPDVARHRVSMPAMRTRMAVAAALATVMAIAPGVPAASAGTAPAAGGPAAAVPLPASPVPAESWCRTVLPEPKSVSRKASRIMAGRVDLGMYGWFRLPAQPTWKPAATLDSSGDAHMNGLHWAIPLLYRGLATGNRGMVDRFYGILASWWATFPPERPRTALQDQAIVAGERVWTLTCASEMAAAAGQDPAPWAGIAQAEAQRLLDRFAVVPGTNNTSLYAQSAALAATCRAGDAAGVGRALGNLSTLADRLVLPDGSDLEGSPHYAMHTLQLLSKANRLADRCGVPHERLAAAIARAQEFLAFATRPDGVLETLGDSPGSRPSPEVLTGGGPAGYAASAGASGQPPASSYRAFEGGYAFGRSTWGGSRAATRAATWYSVRTGRGPAPTAHTHDDIGSVTIMARGVRWIGDPGPWRYDTSTLRRAIVARQAHSALVAIPLPPPPAPSAPAVPVPSPPVPSVVPDPSASAPPPAPAPTPAWTPPAAKPASTLTASQSDGTVDVTCLEDLTYPTAAITRCVRFDRAARTLAVEDVITARQASRIQGRWQVPPGVRVAQRGPVVTLRSGGKRASMTLGGTQLGAISTTRTWFTTRYGAKALGRTVMRQVDLAAGQSVTWGMEFRTK
jgi:hypothetical protein